MNQWKQLKISQRNRKHQERALKIKSQRMMETVQNQQDSLRMRQGDHDEWKLKTLLQSTLKMENEWLQEETRQHRQRMDEEGQRRAEQIASLENYYHDQTSMVQERIRTVQDESKVAAQAHHLSTQQILRELEAERQMGIQKLIGWFQGAAPDLDNGRNSQQILDDLGKKHERLEQMARVYRRQAWT